MKAKTVRVMIEYMWVIFLLCLSSESEVASLKNKMVLVRARDKNGIIKIIRV